jgi:hypothetical protein
VPLTIAAIAACARPPPITGLSPAAEIWLATARRTAWVEKSSAPATMQPMVSVIASTARRRARAENAPAEWLHLAIISIALVM